MEFGLKTGSASRGLLGFFVGLFVFSLGLLASFSEFLVKGESSRAWDISESRWKLCSWSVLANISSSELWRLRSLLLSGSSWGMHCEWERKSRRYSCDIFANCAPSPTRAWLYLVVLVLTQELYTLILSWHENKTMFCLFVFIVVPLPTSLVLSFLWLLPPLGHTASYPEHLTPWG